MEMIRSARGAGPVVMGVLNVTPDSFSDGGEHATTERAVAHGRALTAHGADIVDVGGESTRPGAVRIDAATECDRVISVVEGLTAAGIATSIDTMRSDVARAAVAAGARMVNDVSGGLADPAMLETVAELDVPVVLMHWRGFSEHMDELAHYDDVVAEVQAELSARITAARAAGISADSIIIDPGLGFAKEAQHNWQVLAHLDALASLGHPLLIGASRKRFLGAALADSAGEPRPAADRDAGTAAVSLLCAQAGVWGLRVHDVRSTVDALSVLTHLQEARNG